MAEVKGTFDVVGGGETVIREADGEFKLTRVSGSQKFSGDITGEGSVEWVFCYAPDRTATFTGFQRIEGAICDRKGSLIMESTGMHDGRSSRGTWQVVPGSGRDELLGATGAGSFEAPGGRTVEYRLELELPPIRD